MNLLFIANTWQCSDFSALGVGTVSNLIASATGAMTCCIFVLTYRKRWSLLPLVSGSMASTIAVSICCNVIKPWQSIPVAVFASFICISITQLNAKLQIDDTVNAVSSKIVFFFYLTLSKSKSFFVIGAVSWKFSNNFRC